MTSKTETDKSKNQDATLRLTANAEAVLEARYLMRNEAGELAEKPAELFRRVACAVASAEKAYGLSEGAIETVRDEYYKLMTRGLFMPNSPTLMNAGRASGMLSACFVLPVDDSIDSIFSAIRHTALIQKAGGGTGFSFSRLRPKGDRVTSSGGVTSGPISFMQVFSEATNAIQQGAFRRGANMGIMRVDHPDIVDFIKIKENLSRLTNFNLSVSVTDEFMATLRKNPQQEHKVRNPRTGRESAISGADGKPWTVEQIFDLMVEKAWRSGEPGLIFYDRINAANPTPRLGSIEATNPCGEQPLLPYESCNLGSLNLLKFVTSKAGRASFDFDAFREAIVLAVRFLDDVIDINRYPIAEIAEMSRGNRKIGLGVMGFADALFALGMAYDTEEAPAFGEQVMKFLNAESHRASQQLAAERGCFPNWQGSVWEQRGIPMRNACTTTVAPTGTISIIANCSSGIEPLFSLLFYRNVLDGKRLLEINSSFEKTARARGFFKPELMDAIARTGSIREASDIPEDVRRVFVTAMDIAPEWHIRMQAAFQKHCDASISKTINLPAQAHKDAVRAIFMHAYDAGCKGVTVYRDGCRDNQPMATDKTKKDTAAESTPARYAKPVSLPEVMSAVRIRQLTPFGNMHVKIVIDPITRREFEVFAQLGKGGDLACSDLEGMCRLMSLYLRVGGSIEDIMNQLDGIGSSLTVPTKDGRIASLADGLAKAIEKYIMARNQAGLENLLLGKTDVSGIAKGLKSIHSNGATEQDEEASSFKVKCPECGGNLAFEEGCVKCPGCGFAQC